MSRLNHVDNVLQQFAGVKGIPAISLNAKGSASVAIDDVIISFRYQESPAELLWLMVDLGPAEADEQEDYHRALDAAFSSWTNNVFALGLNPEGDRYHGVSPIPVSILSSESLSQQFDAAVEFANWFTSHTYAH